MNILVVRHAQPADESESGGHGDPPLSEVGHRQARAIADYLRHEEVDHVVSSPLLRARQTAEPFCELVGITLEFDDDLKEAGWQAGPYMRTEENMQFYIDKVAENPEYLYEPEGRDPFNARVDRAFLSVARNNPGGTTVVFCHGMVTISLVTKILGIRPGPDDLNPAYTGLTRVQASSNGELWSLLSFNEAMHLRGL